MRDSKRRPGTSQEAWAALRAGEETARAKAAGLAICGKHSSFFAQLKLGEPLSTTIRKQGGRTRVHTQWWAPRRLVWFNSFMHKQGLSYATRREYLLKFSRGEDTSTWPARLQNAVGSYTEHAILQQLKDR